MPCKLSCLLDIGIENPLTTDVIAITFIGSGVDMYIANPLKAKEDFIIALVKLVYVLQKWDYLTEYVSIKNDIQIRQYRCHIFSLRTCFVDSLDCEMFIQLKERISCYDKTSEIKG